MKEGWLKFHNQGKGALVNRLPGLKKQQKLWFSLSDIGTLSGFTKEDESVPEFKISVDDSAVLISQGVDHQFEVVTDEQHLVFFMDNSHEVNSWVSAIQGARQTVQDSIAPSAGTTIDHTADPSVNSAAGDKCAEQTTEEKYLDPPSTAFSINTSASDTNGGTSEVFDDPLRSDMSNFRLQRSSTSSQSRFIDDLQFEWDSEATSMSSPWVRNEELDERSAVFQLSKELSDAQEKIKKFQQRINSYKEVLAVRDKQLFDIQDRMCDQDKEASAKGEQYQKMQDQVKSSQKANDLLSSELRKMGKDLKKSRQLAAEQKRLADTLRDELILYQRDYVDLLGQLVYRPLANPVEGAVLRVCERPRHVSAVKDLLRSMRKNNGHRIDRPLPSVGNKEFVDNFRFVHNLPNEAMQVEYGCRHLYRAFDILLNEGPEGSTNCLKWKALIATSSDNFQITAQLKKYILDDIPNQYRAYVWQKLIYQQVGELRDSLDGESYYESKLGLKEALLEGDKAFAKNLKQIIMDVPRTMPRNREFSCVDPPLRERLERVLTAFCIHAPDIGYCQGFNFLAGGALLYLQEEDAFWFLISVVQVIFPPEYFLNDLAGLRADQEVLASIIAVECPRLYDHLNRYSKHFEISVVTTSWFLGLFFDCMSFEVLVRVWDCLLAFGHEALFRISCAIFRIFEDRILEITEPSQLLHAIKNLPRLCVRAPQLIEEAFHGLEKFPSWDDLMRDRGAIESKFVEEYNIRLQQCKEYKEKMMKVDSKDDADSINEKLVFDNSTCGHGRVLLCASCRLSESSQLYEVDTEQNVIYDLSLPLTNHVMCCSIADEDVVIVGLFTGQLQAYSISRCFVRWSMSLSNVVISVEITEENVFVGTADSMLHVLKRNEGMGKPTLVDSVELSSSPCCMCLVPSQSSLWVAAGPGIYVIDIETTETEGFFLVSVQKDQISAMHHWSLQVSDDLVRQLVWISIENSSVIQLLDACKFKEGPVLVFDTSNSLSLSLRQPMMREEKSGEEETRSIHVTGITSLSCGQLWLSTSDGHVKKYQVDLINDDEEDAITTTQLVKEEEAEEGRTTTKDDDNESCTTPIVVPDARAQFAMTLLKEKLLSDRLVRCLIAYDNSIMSASGYYGEEESVKRWFCEDDDDRVISIQTSNDDNDDEKGELTANTSVADEDASDGSVVSGDEDGREVASSASLSLALSASMPHIPETEVVKRRNGGGQKSAKNQNRVSAIEVGRPPIPTAQILSGSQSYSTLGAGGDNNAASGETWKTLKTAAASAVSTYKDKSGFRKFIKYFGSNSGGGGSQQPK